MSNADPFGFDAAAADTATTADALDISAFAPRPKLTDRNAITAAREVARDSGFTRRASFAPPAAPEREPAPVAPGVASRKRRVNISEVLGLQDRYPDTQRAQLNMLAPVPILLRWRSLVQAHGVPSWEILEAAMEALELHPELAPKKAATADAA